MSSNLEPLVPTRSATRTTVVILCGFTAALCWWIAIAGVMNSGAGIIFLTIPVVATIATFRAARPQPESRKAKHLNQLHRHKIRASLSAHRRSLAILCGFTAALCWWIAMAGVMNGAAGIIALSVPVLASIGTLWASRFRVRAPRRGRSA